MLEAKWNRDKDSTNELLEKSKELVDIDKELIAISKYKSNQ